MYSKNVVLLRKSHEVPPINITLIFRVTLKGNTLTMFHSHFLIDQDNWIILDTLFKNRYDSCTKQQEASNELATLQIGDFQKDDTSDKDALSKLTYRISRLPPLR